MVVKALGLPRGNRPVVLTGDHEEPPYREFYRIHYQTAGMRAPIHRAEKMLQNADLDPETWFRTFFMVVIGTYFFPGTSSMLPLEYLGSLGDSTLVREYDWAEQIFRHTMSEIKSFQQKMRKASKDGNIKPLWVGGCLPWIAIVYMDDLDFPVSTLSTHRINYAVPKASHVSDKDFKFVMKHDRSRLTIKPHTYGARPDGPEHPTACTNSFTEELPDYMKTIFDKHISLWLKDVDKVTSMLTKMHGKRMTEFSSEVFAAFKNNAKGAHGSSSPPSASTPVTSPPRASTPIFSSPRDEEPVFVEEAANIYDPSSLKQTLTDTKIWEEATRIAVEIEQSAGKTINMNDPSSSNNAGTEDQDITESARPPLSGADIECPSFELFSQPSPRAVANISKYDDNHQLDKHPKSMDKNYGAEPAIKLPSAAKNVASKAPTPDGGQTISLVATISHESPIPDGLQSMESGCMYTSPIKVSCTVGTQTQDKKNRKKRAFLGLNNDANQKKLKKLKVTDESKEVYDTYIIRRCIRPPVVGEEERQHFVDFGDHHISYEDFREALKPRGRIDNHVMELFIRQFNLVVNIPTTSEPMCTKFAFSQSLTAKLSVHEDKFDPKSCLKEFMAAYKNHKLKSKDMLHFAVVDNDHWILVSINLLHKQVNALDSMMSAKKTKVYEKAHFLVNNFITLASYAKAFPKTNFNQYVQNNPQELRQQTTLFDCGVFVMLFMKLWDGKIMKPFSLEMIGHRMVITHMIMTSELNKADPTWVLKKK